MTVVVQSNLLNTSLNTTIIGAGGMIGFGLFYTLLNDDLVEENNRKLINIKSIFNLDNIINPLGLIGLIGGFYCGYKNTPIRFF